MQFLHSAVQLIIYIHKVLSLLEACFDLISGSSLSMKIQIMGGKITENLGFKSPLWKVKKFLFFFLFIFKFFTQKWISFILTILQFFMENLKMNRKRTKTFLTFWSGDSNPRFSVIFPPMIWIFMEGEGDEIKSWRDQIKTSF